MNSTILNRIFAVVQFQYAVVLLIIAVFCWLFYRIALKDLSQHRHKIFNKLFKELRTASFITLTSYASYLLVHNLPIKEEWAQLTTGYLGLLTILLAAHVFIKIWQILANEYFFFKSKKAGVPLLLVNIVSLILFLLILAWLLTYLFNVKVASVLATSAVLTIVLGLALQDTLGNLFAAISIQIDKPFEMDDWIELKSGGEKIVGQVKELSWRATLLQAITDEMITIPNRTISQWQIVNFSARNQPFLRGQYFRLPLNTNLAVAKNALLSAMKSTPGLLLEPAPLVLVNETTPSWILVKAIYACNDYGNQYILADRFYEVALATLAKEGIVLANDKMQIESIQG